MTARSGTPDGSWVDSLTDNPTIQGRKSPSFDVSPPRPIGDTFRPLFRSSEPAGRYPCGVAQGAASFLSATAPSTHDKARSRWHNAMSAGTTSDVTRILTATERGDAQAVDELLPLDVLAV
jgi:hypothetical protein